MGDLLFSLSPYSVLMSLYVVADRGGKGAMIPPPRPCEISHKKMAAKGGHMDFMFITPPSPHLAAGYATGINGK